MDKQHEGRQLNLDPPPHWFLQRGNFQQRVETFGSCNVLKPLVPATWLKPSVRYRCMFRGRVSKNKSYSGDTDLARVALTPGPTSLQAALM
jgi:hypothetical protein